MTSPHPEGEAAAEAPPRVHPRLAPRLFSVLAAGAALLVVFLVLYTLITGGNLHWDIVAKYFVSSAVLKGVGVTLFLTLSSLAASLVLGTVLAAMRISRNRVLNAIAAGYIWFFRGTPLIVQVVFWFNLGLFIPQLRLFGWTWPTNSIITPTTAALLGLFLNVSAFMCEVIRGGLLSVDAGQTEAALSIGMMPRQALLRIVLPQAFRVILPPAGNLAIDLLKATSLVYVIGTKEILGTVQAISAQNFYVIEMLIVASAWYLVLVSIASFLQSRLEAHFGKGIASAGRAASHGSRPRKRVPVAVSSAPSSSDAAASSSAPVPSPGVI